MAGNQVLNRDVAVFGGGFGAIAATFLSPRIAYDVDAIPRRKKIEFHGAGNFFSRNVFFIFIQAANGDAIQKIPGGVNRCDPENMSAATMGRRAVKIPLILFNC